MVSSTWKILLIDPQQGEHLHTQALLQQIPGHQVSLDWAASYLAGRRALLAGSFDAALIENDLGSRSGIDLVRELAAEECTVPLILYVGRGSYEIDLDAMQAGASLYLPKAEATPEVLERSIRYAIERRGFEEELYRANRSLRQERAHLEAVLQQMPSGVIIVRDPSGELILSNQQVLDIWPNLFKPAAHGQPAPLADWLPVQVGRGEEVLKDQEIQVERSDGQTGILSVSASPIYDDNGRVISRVVVIHDITRRKGVEEALRRSQQDLAHAQAVAHTGSWRLNVKEDHLLWSDETYQIFDVPPGTYLTFAGFLEMVHPEDREYVSRSWATALQGEPYDIEHRIVVNDQVKWVREQAVLEFDPGGNVLSGFGAVRDITVRKLAEQALQQNQAILQDYAARLERSNRELEEFAFVASHDLQEPLRKIESFGKLLEDAGQNLDATSRLYVDRMRQAARRMSSMVDDLLSLSRVTTQGRPFVPVDLGAVAAEILSDLENQIGRTGGQVEVAPLPVVAGDPPQLRQLFQNLIGNALKYHQDGEPPRVRVYAAPVASSQVQILVEDNGIGFEEIYTDRIFQPFQRLVGKGEYEGSGIGLAICRKIVERHGGSITARSNPGCGSTFIVSLPSAAIPEIDR